MKRYTYKFIFVMILLCFIVTSCKKDYLNIVPQGSQIAVTTNDYNLILNTPDLYAYIGTLGSGWQLETLMGDDIAAESSFYTAAKVESKNAFEWADDIYLPTDKTYDMASFLLNLYNVNKVINEVLQSPGGTDQQKLALQAEARADRAWLYFQFVNFYGKSYVSSTAATDPAFPIIKTADITAAYPVRNSVQEVYDFIISDFTAAIANLPVQNSSATRFSKAAAEGLLGKVYLFMGNNTQALALFNAAFIDNAAQTTPARLYDYNKEFATGGKFLPISPLTGPANSPGNNYNDITESVLARSFYDGKGNGLAPFGNDFVILSAQATALYNASDLRLKFFAAQLPNFSANPSGRLSKYAEQYPKFGLQISELYLLRAEVKARLNDLTGAQTDVETLRKYRMPVANATVSTTATSSQTGMIQFIFDEREREFATEGYRWFDMRRMAIDPIFTGITYSHTLYNNTSGTNTTTYTLRPVRLTLRLPQYITIANPQIINNP